MKKSFTDLFIRKPVIAIVVNVVIVLAGFQAIGVGTIARGLKGLGLPIPATFTNMAGGLNIRQYPRSENSTVTIMTVYVGANADLVRGFVTTPIEQAVSSADGIDYVESSSLQNISIVSAHLKLNYEPTKALAEITSKVNQVRNNSCPGSAGARGYRGRPRR